MYKRCASGLSLFFVLSLLITPALAIDKQQKADLIEKSDTRKPDTSPWIVDSNSKELTIRADGENPAPVATATPITNCNGIVCQDCTEVCSNGRCVPTGKLKCRANGVCRDSGEECRCSQACQPCTESCQAGADGKYGCKPTGKELCAVTGECEDPGYCRENCGGITCKKCIERCDDAPDGSKHCVSSGRIICAATGACVDAVSIVNCTQPGCSTPCRACTELCRRNDSDGTFSCTSSGNILCPDGTCRLGGGTCPTGGQSQKITRDIVNNW